MSSYHPAHGGGRPGGQAYAWALSLPWSPPPCPPGVSSKTLPAAICLVPSTAALHPPMVLVALPRTLGVLHGAVTGLSPSRGGDEPAAAVSHVQSPYKGTRLQQERPVLSREPSLGIPAPRGGAKGLRSPARLGSRIQMWVDILGCKPLHRAPRATMQPGQDPELHLGYSRCTGQTRGSHHLPPGGEGPGAAPTSTASQPLHASSVRTSQGTH